MGCQIWVSWHLSTLYKFHRIPKMVSLDLLVFLLARPFDRSETTCGLRLDCFLSRDASVMPWQLDRNRLREPL